MDKSQYINKKDGIWAQAFRIEMFKEIDYFNKNLFIYIHTTTNLFRFSFPYLYNQ